MTKDGWNFDKELREICAMKPGPEKERRRKDWARRLHQTFTKPRPTVLRWHRVSTDEP